MNIPEPASLPPPRAAILLFVAVLVSNFLLGIVLAGARVEESWILVATPLVVLFWTAVAVRYFRVDVKETLLLRLPSAADLLMAIPLAIAFVILSDQVSNLFETLIPAEIRAHLLELVRVKGPTDWVVKLATIGLGAAVSEELMLRGFILSVFCRGMNRSSAIFVTALLFTALHVLPLPSIAAAGVVLGFTALATRSIVVPILIHFVNNLYVLALVNLAHLETLGDPVWIPPEILLPAVAIFVLTMAYYGRHLASPPAPASTASSIVTRGDGSEREMERGEWGERGADSTNAPTLRRHPTLSEELATIPGPRRRLGWAVVVLAILLGSSVLLGLFFWIAYRARPESIQKPFIQAMSQDALERLAPEARGREGDISSSFRALEAVSDSGRLDESHLWDVLRVYAESVADGSVDSAEAEILVTAIRRAVAGATSPRRL
jgi:membrane protease YdiL (CAAX protease family)